MDVVLKADGTVVVTGANGYNLINVSDWKNIVAVSAGEDHIVGLKADGKTIDVLSIYGVLVGIDEGVLEGDERGVFGKIFLGILGIEGSFEVIPAEYEIDGDVVFVFVRFKVADGELLGESR